MSFYRSTPNIFNYMLDRCSVERLTYVNDLGIVLDHKLKFNSLIDRTVNKATQTLGFFKRWSKEFDDSYTTKLLYTSLVHPILEHGFCSLYTRIELCLCKRSSYFLLFVALAGIQEPTYPLLQ